MLPDFQDFLIFEGATNSLKKENSNAAVVSGWTDGEWRGGRQPGGPRSPRNKACFTGTLAPGSQILNKQWMTAVGGFLFSILSGDYIFLLAGGSAGGSPHHLLFESQIPHLKSENRDNLLQEVFRD